MPVNTDTKQAGDSIQLVAKRADGSIRQLLVQDTFGNVIGRGFFPHGTFMEGDWKSKRKYHWIDAWSDEELLNPENELTFTKEVIFELRKASLTANKTKTFVVESLDNYRKK